MQRRWDIFCNIVDNYGDVGVSWRLARQLVKEYQLVVRLWVDNLASFACIAPDIDPSIERQYVQGVEIRHWRQPFDEAEPAEVVIEAFACDLPDSYIAAMAQLQQRPIWINLEYLSAETWISDYHTLPSLHPFLPLVKYFFFPGFVNGTGGLLRENQLLSAHCAFDVVAQSAFWRRLNIPMRREGEWRISLFCYDGAPLKDLFSAWSDSKVPVYVLIPHGPIAEKVAAYFCAGFSDIGDVFQLGQLTIQFIPFLAQTEYDYLLWACDYNFVRGEDSFVRAQWAAQPFVWHIYPQPEGAHWAKLDAFLNLYTAEMEPKMAAAVRAFWYSWNDNNLNIDTWLTFTRYYAALCRHGKKWVARLCCQADLASNLVRFVRNQI